MSGLAMRVAETFRLEHAQKITLNEFVCLGILGPVKNWHGVCLSGNPEPSQELAWGMSLVVLAMCVAQAFPLEHAQKLTLDSFVCLGILGPVKNWDGVCLWSSCPEAEGFLEQHGGNKLVQEESFEKKGQLQESVCSSTNIRRWGRCDIIGQIMVKDYAGNYNEWHG